MVGELVMLPVRVGVRATRLWFRAVEETVSVTATTTGRVIELLSSHGSGKGAVGTAPRPPASTTARPSPGEAPAEGDEDRAGDSERPHGDREPLKAGGERLQAARERPPAPAQPPTEVRDFAPPAPQPVPVSPLSAEPTHVSEEPELVEEFAEPGAEDGAGAEVHVNPPWDGYEGMNVKQVISRLASAGPEDLAAVELYEGTHRRRQTILNAVDRELRHANGSGSQAQEGG